MIPIDRVANGHEQEAGVVAVLQVIWNYKIYIFLATSVCALASIIYALLATPMYRAEIGITEVSVTGLNGAGALANQLSGLAGLVGVNLGTGNGGGHESQAVLKSRRVVEEFVKRHPMAELFPAQKQLPTLWFAVRRFQQNVFSIRDDKRAGTTIVAVNFTEPVTAARWANEFVALVNDILRTHAMDEAKRNIEYLNEQIAKTNTIELQRVMYNLIENETKTLMLANVRAEYAFRVVDPAVPPEVRTSPQRTIIVLGGILLGFLIGTTAAVAHNTWRTQRLRSSQS